jgi:hypothetical protein
MYDGLKWNEYVPLQSSAAAGRSAGGLERRAVARRADAQRRSDGTGSALGESDHKSRPELAFIIELPTIQAEPGPCADGVPVVVIAGSQPALLILDVQ